MNENKEINKTKVRIIQISKCHFRIEDLNGIKFGEIKDGVAEYLEFRNWFSAKAYIDLDKRLMLAE
ncbi:MAG: hypothetical protein ACRC7N_01275 [Clostridium sp.]